MGKAALTPAQRKRRQRRKEKRLKLRRLEIIAHMEDVPEIKAFADTKRKEREDG